MFSNLLIGLREGLEAALVVGILVAYLRKTSNDHRLPAVWLGVGVAVVASLLTGALLTFTSSSLTFEAQETFGGVMSIIAVVFVTSMIFWMRRQSRHLSGELRGKLDVALTAGAFAVGLTAFLAVAREGLETALFLWPTLRAAGSGAGPAVGAVIGIALAIAIAWGIQRGAVHLDLAVFFRVTGSLLIVVAAGVLAYGVHDLQEAGVLPGLTHLAFDVSAQIPPSSWYATLLKGIFNVSPRTTWLQAVVWFAYLIPTMYLFLRPVREPARLVPEPVAA